MAKVIKKNTAFSASLSAEDKKHYEHSLVMSQDGMTYLYSNPAATVGIVNPRHVYNNFKAFSDTVSEPELRAFYTQTHNEPLKSEVIEDLVELQVEVWILLCKTAANRLKEVRQVGADGKAVRVSKKMENRSYEVIKLEVAPDVKLPPQARTCLVFFAELQAEDTKAKQAKDPNYNPADGVFSILEKTFNEYVVANAERLKTRQDPWRIFQYYRPVLIQGGFLRLV
jgi:hypothetical protein